MSDSKQSDLSLLAIQRDFSNGYGKITDTFAIQHKTSQIVVK
jgi:hypothetical protein